MKNTTKQKLKKIIYTALVVSYILIITIIPARATESNSDYWSGNTDIFYVEQDNREVTYPSYTDISIVYYNNNYVAMNILVTNINETNYLYKSQELSGFNINYNGTTYGANFYQALAEVPIKYQPTNTTIYVQIRNKVEYVGSSQLLIKVTFNTPETSIVSIKTLLEEFENSGTDMTDSYVTNWGMILLANALIQNDNYPGIIYQRGFEYNGSYKTPIEIDEMITQGNAGAINGIYNELLKPYEPSYDPFYNGNQHMQDIYDQLIDEDSQQDFIQSIEDTVLSLEQSPTIILVTQFLNEILSMPFVVSIVPIAMFFVMARVLLH